MSLNPEKIKNVVIKGIQVNPTNIEIKETIKLEKDGAFEEVETTKNLTVIIYYQNTSETRKDTDKIGTSYSNKSYSMIADYTANLGANSRNKVIFTCTEGDMIITAVNPIVVKGVICGYECNLERIE